MTWTPEQIAIVASALAALIGAIAAVASAIFAGVALRAQHRAQNAHLRVSHANVMPVYGGGRRSLAGSTLGDLWFAIEVYNDGLIPVTVKSVGVAFEDGGSAPFLRSPWPEGDELPKDLAAGEEATFYLDPVVKVAEAHAEHRAKWVYARLGGNVEFHGKRIDENWLDGWAKRGVGAT